MKNNNSGTKRRSVSAMIRGFDSVAFFRLENLIRNIPFFLFLTILGIVYIWNTNRGVKMVREIGSSHDRMMDAQYYFTTARDSLTHESRQSAVANLVDSMHMQELTKPPFTIKE